MQSIYQLEMKSNGLKNLMKSFQSAFLSYVSNEAAAGDSTNSGEAFSDSETASGICGIEARNENAAEVTDTVSERGKGVVTRSAGRLAEPPPDSNPPHPATSRLRSTRVSSRTSSPNIRINSSTVQQQSLAPSTPSTSSERSHTPSQRARMKDLHPGNDSSSDLERESREWGKDFDRESAKSPAISLRTKRLVKAPKVEKSDKKFLKPAVVCLGSKVKMKRSPAAVATPSKHSRHKDSGKKKLLRMCGKLKRNAQQVRLKMKSREGEESSSVAHRPKRAVKIPRSLEYTAALSRIEERELKKALYASLQETKKAGQSLATDLLPSYETENAVGYQLGKKLKQSGLKLKMPPTPFSDHGQDSNRSSAASTASSTGQERKSLISRPPRVGGKSPLRAQRKFAEGSRPCSPVTHNSSGSISASSSPSKPKSHSLPSTPRKLLNPNRRAKTEDFLTFLCLRGSHFLPPHLEFFNYSEVDSLPSFPGTPRQSQDGSRPTTPQSSSLDTPRGMRNGRDTTPALSRASSPDREILIDNKDLGVRPLVAGAAAKQHATGGTPSSSSTALRVMGASRRSVVRRKSSSTASSSSACVPASAVHSQVSLTPATDTAATSTTCTASMFASSPSSAPPACALKMRASPSCHTRQSARQAAAARMAESDGSSPSTTSNTPSSIEFGDPTSLIEAVDLTTTESPQAECLEVSTQTPYPCIDDLPDIVDSTPEEDTDNTQDESADESPCQELVPYEMDGNQVELHGESPLLSASHVPLPSMYTGLPTAYGMDVPALQPLAQVGSVPLNLSVNLGSGSMSIPACLTGSIQCPLAAPLDMASSPVNPALLSPSMPNYVVQCQGVIQPTSLMVTSVPSFRCQPFLTTSPTLVATETGLTLVQCQPQLAPSPMTALQGMNSTLSISLMPPSAGAGMVTRSGSRPIAPAPPDLRTGDLRGRHDTSASTSLHPVRSKTSKLVSATKPSPKVSHKQLKKGSVKKLQRSRPSEVKARGHGHSTGQGVIEVDDEIDIVMPERRLHTGQSLKNEARKRLIRKARSHASKAVERRRLRSDTRREQDYELAVAQGFSDDMEEIMHGGTQVVKKRGRPRDPAKASKRKQAPKSKAALAMSGDKKRKVRKSVRDLLEEAESPHAATGAADGLIKMGSCLARAPSKSSVVQKSDDVKLRIRSKKRSHSVDSCPTKKLKFTKVPSPVKDCKRPTDGKKHRRSESAMFLVGVTASGITGKKAQETSVERHKVGSLGLKQPLEKAARLIRASSSKKGTPKSLSAPAPVTRRLSDPVIITAVREPFPSSREPAQTVDIPTYHPSTEQFQDPISYMDSIEADAESFGICCVVPPDGWKPECQISENLRFTTQIQHINKMQDRWGSNVFQLECIKKHLETQGRHIENIPLIGGVELDLPMLATVMKSCGGLQEVIDKNKWLKVADQLCIPRMAQDRTTKLYDAYCRYLLSYDTLTDSERAKIEAQVEADKRKKSQVWDQGCVSRGKSKTLSDFFRVARNTLSVYFSDTEPTVEEVEHEYWRLVQDKSQHVSIQTAHVDTKACGSAFPTKKESPYSRHGWNFHILQHNNGSVLKFAGPVSGVSVPTLHIGMLFSTNCLSRNMHLLPYISYLHSGADVIWYAIPKSEEGKLKKVLEKLVPDLINPDEPLWLPEDSVMVWPQLLQEHGISMCRKVQRQGEFMVVQPQTFTATISTGYNIGESIHFATVNWLPLGVQAAKVLQESGEPEMFSMDRLYISLARSEKASCGQLRAVLPYLHKLVDHELQLRRKLTRDLGLKVAGHMACPEFISSGKRKHQQRYEMMEEDEENRCETFKKICYLSKVVNHHDNTVHCLESVASGNLSKKQQRHCKILIRFTEAELKAIVQNVESQLTGSDATQKKKGPRLKRASHPS